MPAYVADLSAVATGFHPFVRLAGRGPAIAASCARKSRVTAGFGHAQSRTVRPKHQGSFRLILATLVGFWLAAPLPCAAEPRVEGTREAASLRSNEATVAEILAAFGTEFDVRFQTAVTLDQRVSGTYRGSLTRVLAKVLDGYDYVITTSGRGVELSVLRANTGGPKDDGAIQVLDAVPSGEASSGMNLSSDARMGTPGSGDRVRTPGGVAAVAGVTGGGGTP
jgi:hypothetical protein